MHLFFTCTASKLQISLLSTFHWPRRTGACTWQAFPGQSPTHVSFVLLCNLLKRIMSKSISNLGFSISILAFENLRSFISPALSDCRVINRTQLFWSDSLSVTALLKTPAVCLAWWSLCTSKECPLSRAWRVGLVMNLAVPTCNHWGSRNFLSCGPSFQMERYSTNTHKQLGVQWWVLEAFGRTYFPTQVLVRPSTCSSFFGKDILDLVESYQVSLFKAWHICPRVHLHLSLHRKY